MSTSARHCAESERQLGLPARYAIRRRIATGGMASVWCAEDRLLGRPVAIKVLSERFADDPLAIRRFKREARAAARVSAHPNVVTIFDIGEVEADDGETPARAFIVMEYLTGGTVADALTSGPAPRSQARRWLREAASALDFAHERGVVHRDVKPSNFLLSRDRVLHVADFGIARLQSEDTITSSGELFGTAAYLAPEQALGQEATSASDRYSLAVVAFELLTGARPFAAGSFAAQARRHIEEQPPSASARDRALPAAVDQVLRRGMAKSPLDRYPTAGGFVDALEAALQAIPAALQATPAALQAKPAALQAKPAPRPRSTGPRRHGGRAIAVAALAVVALGVIVLATQLSSHSSSGASRLSSNRRASVTSSRHPPANSSATQTASTPAAATSTPAAATSTPAAATSTPTRPASPQTGVPPSAGAAALELRGHDQLLAGDYPAAISTLRSAVAAASPGTLTYAYALYDLGHALLLSGDPAAAIPILQQRLKIPNQTGIVRQTLDQALAAAGASPAAHPGASSGPNPQNGPLVGAGAPGPGHGHGLGQDHRQGPGPVHGHGAGNGNGHGRAGGGD